MKNKSLRDSKIFFLYSKSKNICKNSWFDTGYAGDEALEDVGHLWRLAVRGVVVNQVTMVKLGER